MAILRAMATGARNGRIVRLTTERLQRLERRMAAAEDGERGTNARLEAMNERLEQAVNLLTRLVRVVAAQNSRMKQNGRVSQRIDRLAKAIMKGRTSDLRRLGAAERRLEALERELS
jgi:ABC-type transporter Mla subunit MlaD